jgi:hypothetical protein
MTRLNQAASSLSPPWLSQEQLGSFAQSCSGICRLSTWYLILSFDTRVRRLHWFFKCLPVGRWYCLQTYLRTAKVSGVT